MRGLPLIGLLKQTGNIVGGESWGKGAYFVSVNRQIALNKVCRGIRWGVHLLIRGA